MEQINLKEGQAVFQVGEQSNHVFLILHGVIGLYSPLDMTLPYQQLFQGDVFGETGLLKNKLRCAKALCLEECEILRISKQDFLKRLDSCDPLLRRLLNTKVNQSLKDERSTSPLGVSEAA